MGNSNQYELTEEVLKHFTLHSYVLDISVHYVDQVYTRKKWYKKVFLFMEDGNPTVRVSQFSGDSVWKKISQLCWRIWSSESYDLNIKILTVQCFLSFLN